MTDEYLKVLNTIYSCTTEQQLLVTQRMVELLEKKHGAEYRSLHKMCEVLNRNTLLLEKNCEH